MTPVRSSARKRPLLSSLLGVGLVLVIAWQAAAWTLGSDDRGRAAEARVTAEPGLTLFPREERPTAPSLEGTTLDGGTWSLSALAGKIVVINVWGSWCGPCRAETPDLVRVARETSRRGVRFVGVDTRDNLAAARSFTKRYDVPYPSVVDEDGQVLLGFRYVIPSAVVPTTIVIDRSGKVAARIIGPVTYTTLKGILIDEIAATGGAS